MADELLRVRGLTVEFGTEFGPVTVVDNVGFTIAGGETLGLVGESGSGKTVTSLALLGLIGSPAGRIRGGEVLFEGRDLLSLPPESMRELRGREIGMIFQDPIRSLDPAFTVGQQVAEVVRVHLGTSRRLAWERAVEMLDLVGIPSASQRAREYPHTFSGGMCQRVMIAMALACRPQLLIADEPTTALDVTVQAQILELLRSLQSQMGLAILFITHDLGVIAKMCDRIAVMYAGQIVEQAPSVELFVQPEHPYTEGLISSIIEVHIRDRQLGSIPGTVPAPHDWPEGCRFHPRCGYAQATCSATPPLLKDLGDQRQARCLFAGSLSLRGIQ